MALKVLDVEGERLKGAEGTTKDFIMVNGTVFQAKTGADFLKSRTLFAKTIDRIEGRPQCRPARRDLLQPQPVSLRRLYRQVLGGAGGAGADELDRQRASGSAGATGSQASAAAGAVEAFYLGPFIATLPPEAPGGPKRMRRERRLRDRSRPSCPARAAKWATL